MRVLSSLKSLRYLSGIVFLTLLLPETVYGQEKAISWKQEKCVRYSAAWDEALTLFDKSQMTADFVNAHERFIETKCDHDIHVCPVSDYDLEVANAMVVASMNAGTASTFPPFTCRDENKELPNYKGDQ
ncbi:hypothetical protein [Ahrensia marina]|uniref:Uncharacterized protein n=1 Tax=Ahrensia marina TaxID=1514904 RepID=A0A0N0E7D7_9HYPH|nr:hypothetical protein [Ahrensia marina]KPB01068.1 hypothetical protein SU32_10560 [Ahrensia marina]